MVAFFALAGKAAKAGKAGKAAKAAKGTKTLKTVASEMNKGLTTREASRIAQNERRKAERRLARVIQEETGKKVSRSEALKTYNELKLDNREADMLSQKIVSLQAKKVEGTNIRKGYAVDVLNERKNIESYTMVKYGTESLSKKGDVSQLRKNELFTRQINQSTSKNGFSLLSGENTKAFYAATKDLWNGVSTADNRNVEIMSEMGIGDLETAYRLFTDEKLDYKNFGFSSKEDFDAFIDNLDVNINFSKRREIIQEELKNIKNSKKTGGNTNESQYNGSEVKDVDTSPDYINRIISRISIALNNG